MRTCLGSPKVPVISDYFGRNLGMFFALSARVFSGKLINSDSTALKCLYPIPYWPCGFEEL